MPEYYLMKSLVPKKKFTIIRFDSTGKLPLKKVHFGAQGYEDFTTHKNEERKQRYLARHEKNEDWTKTGMSSAGFWSRFLLWNKPTLNESIKDVEKRFGIKIKYVKNEN